MMRNWIDLFEMQTPESNPKLMEWLLPSKVKHLVFHGTHQEIEGNLRTTNGLLFFSEDPDIASSFAGTDVYFGVGEQTPGGKVFPTYIRLINPYIPECEEEYCDVYQIEPRAEELRQMGHDGFICNSDGGEQFCVFSADQVWNAFDNGGTEYPL